MNFTAEEIDEIQSRNRARWQSQLPSLNVEDEICRLRAAAADAEFEAHFLKEKHKYAHLWSNRSNSWLSNMGIWSSIRREIRHAFLASNSGVDGK